MSDVATGLLQPATSSKSLLSLLYYCYTDLGAVVCLRHLQMQMSVDTKLASSQKKKNNSSVEGGGGGSMGMHL